MCASNARERYVCDVYIEREVFQCNAYIEREVFQCNVYIERCVHRMQERAMSASPTQTTCIRLILCIHREREREKETRREMYREYNTSLSCNTSLSWRKCGRKRRVETCIENGIPLFLGIRLFLGESVGEREMYTSHSMYTFRESCVSTSRIQESCVSASRTHSRTFVYVSFDVYISKERESGRDVERCIFRMKERCIFRMRTRCIRGIRLILCTSHSMYTFCIHLFSETRHVDSHTRDMYMCHSSNSMHVSFYEYIWYSSLL